MSRRLLSTDRHPTASRGGVLLFALLPLLLAVACHSPDPNGRGGVLTVAGSTSVQPFAEKLAEDFMARNPGKEINVQGGGSTAGVKAAMTGAAQVGMSSRHLKPEESGLTPITIAHDGIAIIVHSTNPLRGLTRDQVASVFAGRVTRWEQLGSGSGEIHFVTREEGSGTRGAFEEMVMGERLISPRALVQDSNGAVREIVADDPKALGYISLGLLDARVTALAIDGVRPARETIHRKEYAVVRPFLFLVNGELRGTAKEYVDYVMGPEGQRLLALEGLIPVLE